MMLRSRFSLAFALATAVAFGVSCGDQATTAVSPTPDGPSFARNGGKGNLSVSVSTTGSSLDPDGYSVSVDGSSKTLSTNGSASFPNLDVGSHTATLSGLAPNCTAATNPQSVNVAKGSTTNAQFQVSCAAVATTGTVTVTATTTGADPDTNGYVVIVDKVSTGKRVPANGSFDVVNLSPGSHTVGLDVNTVKFNCTLTSTNPQTVNVVAGATATASFTITCSGPQPGSLIVTTSTTGSNLDPDGYKVTIDGDTSTAKSIGVKDSTTFANLSAGSHTATLSGLAANCSATTNPQSVTITTGATTRAAFSINCSATTGTLNVVATTSGASLDPDGYTVTLDGNAAGAKPIGVNDSTTFASLSPGSHSAALSGLAANCSATSNPQNVTIAAGTTTRLAFSINCSATTSTTYTFAGAGDVASCSWFGDDTTAILLDQIVAADPNTTVFVAGDIEYDNATAAEYTNCYEPTWGRHKARTYVALGNHEYNVDPNPTWDYFGSRAGPRGLGYYSYDLGAWHIVMLNDNIDFSPGSAQDQWLQQDLASSTRRCTIAIWHQPLFYGSTLAVTPSRKPFWDRLYAAGAEIVINGHLHQYERYAPQTPTGALDNATGIREFVAGTGGNTNSLPDARPNQEKIGNSRGVLKLTLTDTGYSWVFIPLPGRTFTDSGSGTCH